MQDIDEEVKVSSPNVIPPEIKKWNWGAFMLNIVWGIGNKAYLTLLCFIPLFNLVWFFVCGAKGNEWAWKKGNYSSAEEFLKVQETWNRAGLFQFLIVVAGLLFGIIIYAMVVIAVLNI